MISINIDAKQLKKLRAAVDRVGKKGKFNRELGAAINATARKVITASARELRKEIAVPVRILKKAIKQKSKANAQRTYAVIGFWGGHPIPLKYFGAKQTKSGVTWRQSPKHGRRRIERDAFIPRVQYNGNVYRRQSAARGPLVKLHGPSPGEAFKAIQIEKLAMNIAGEELPKQMERRIKLNILRAEGLVSK